MFKRIFVFLITLFGISIMECQAQEIINTKYFKTTYDSIGNIISNEEILETDFNNSSAQPYSTYLFTEYKQLSIFVQNGIVTVECKWKYVPKYTSFDVIAIRGEGVGFNTNAVQGRQLYIKNGTSDIISYTNNTTNTKIFGTGVGVSMNLVDSASNYTLKLSVPYTVVGNNPVIYGSYQHATRNIDLTTSQRYSLNSIGYGNVLLFESPVNSYYDGMGGVKINL